MLAPEVYVNDNDGLNEPGESVQPNNTNTVGNIRVVGVANSGIDLLTVNLETLTVSAIGTGLSQYHGANLVVGTITFDSAAKSTSVGAALNVNGANNTTVASLDATDGDIDTLSITNSGSGNLVITGASPAASLGNAPAVSNVEALVINATSTGSVTLGTAGDPTKPGVVGDDLSSITVNGALGVVNLGVIAQIDGSNDGMANAFTLNGSGKATTFGVLGEAIVGGVPTAPTLLAGSTWVFENATLTLTDDVVLGAGTVAFDNVALTISGHVDFTTLAQLTLHTADVTIEVPAGSSLTILAEDASGLTITGDGLVTVMGVEDTLNVNLANVMTSAGDTGTVIAHVDTSDGADLDLLPDTVVLAAAANLGKAQVMVDGGGTLDVTHVPVNRLQATWDHDANGATPNLTVMATFNVAAATTLVVTAAQGDDRSVTGAGTTNVEDIGIYAGTNVMSLAGVVTSMVNIAVDTSVTLNSADNLGAAGVGRVTTIAPTATLTAAGSVVNGQYITSSMATVAGTNGTLVIDDENNATPTTDTPITADLSHVSVEFIALAPTALVGTITFPVLYGDPVAKYVGNPLAMPAVLPNPNLAVQTVTLTAVQASGQTIVGAGAGAQGEVVVNDLDGAFTNLSLVNAGLMTAHVVDTSVVLNTGTDLGAFDVVVDAVAGQFTLTAAQADGIQITESGAPDATVTVTALAATLNADLSAIAVAIELALLDANGGVTLGANLGTNMEVIVSDSVPGVGTNVVSFAGSMVSSNTTFTIASDAITLVFDANDAHELTVAETGGGVANSTVTVNNVDGDLMNLANITADTMIANVPADAVMHANTDFGGFVVRLAEGADITMTYDQFLNVAGDGALAAGDFDSAAGGVEEIITVTGWDATVALNTALVLPNLALKLEVDATGGATQTVAIATNLSGVEEIVIPAGVTLTMTADQFQQIQHSVTVTGAGTLNLTMFDNDNASIDLSSVTAVHGTISLDPSKGATQLVAGQVEWVVEANKIVLAPTAKLGGFGIIMTASNQGITLSSETQADGRSVTEVAGGVTNSRLILGFDTPDATDGDSNILATNFKVDHVLVLNTYLSNQFGGVTPANIETFLTDLDSGIPVRVFDADDALTASLVSYTAVASVNRTVTIEPNTRVDASLAFNDVRPDSEVRNLTLNLRGNSVIDGNLTLPQNQDPAAQLPLGKFVQLFDTLSINSTDATGLLVSPNVINGSIIGNTALNGAESQVEVFTLTLDAAMLIAGSEDQIGFDGAVVNLADTANVDAVGAAIAAASYNNWRATYDALTNVVTFTNITAGVTADAAIGSFTFLQNGGSSVAFPGTSAVAVAQQGSFAAGENNLLNVSINATHDLTITGELEFSYVSGTSSILNSVVDETAEANLVIRAIAGVTVNIGSVDTSDDHITALNFTKTGTGTVNAPGTSPGASVGDTETLNITQVNGGLITFGTTGDLAKPGVAGDDLSLIDLNGRGTIDLGVIALVDANAFELNTDGMLAGSVVNAALRADMASTGTWTFDNSAGLGEVNLTIAGTGVVDSYGVDPVYGAAFGAGGTLVFNNINLLVEGDVDLSAVLLTLANTSSISVLAGSTLTLTVAQVLAFGAANLDITGEGTVAVIGDATNVLAGDLGEALRTVGVDLSGVTLDLALPAPVDADGKLAIVLLGALVDDGNPANGYNPVVAAGQNVIGSANDDAITTSGQNDTLTGGLGNDALNGSGGNDTYNVDAGTDTVVGLNTGDVLVVSAGASTSPVIGGSFVATAASSNNGTVTLTDGTPAGNTTIDMSLAGGANGYTITGGNSPTAGTDTLIGSAQADVINGGNTTQTTAAAQDILTGNGGADRFNFNLTLGSAATLTVLTTQGAIDREIITFVADAAADGTETITVYYTVNGIVNAAIIDLSLVNTTDLAAVTAAAVAQLDSRAGIAATGGAAGQVVISGDNGASVTVLGSSVNAGWTAASPTTSNGTDQAQITTVTVAGTPTTGDYYSLVVDYFNGTGTTSDHTAIGGDTSSTVAAGLMLTDMSVVTSTHLSGSSVVTFTANSADNGGFEIQKDTTAAFAGSGASDNGAVNYLTADIITDFTPGVDSISFGLVAGVNGVNFVKAAVAATDYNDARNDANAAFDGTVQYYTTWATDFDGASGTGLLATGQEGAGLLFFDANLDGNVDGVVVLVGITSNFIASDIVA